MKNKNPRKLSSTKIAVFQKNITAILFVGVLLLQPLQPVGIAHALTQTASQSVTQANSSTNGQNQVQAAAAQTADQAIDATKKAAKGAATQTVNSVINAAHLPPSAGIEGKCLNQAIDREAMSVTAGVSTALIGGTLATGEMFTNVPSISMGISSGANLQSGEGVATTMLTYLKPITDCLIHEASQLMIDQLSTMVTNAIYTGLGGSPNYSTNVSQLLSNLSRIVSGQLKNQINSITLCGFGSGNDGFKTNLSNSIGLSTRSTSRQSFATKLGCPFSTPAASNDFYDDFNAGGWGAFQKTLSNSGNPFGVSLIANMELSAREEEARNLAETQLAQGNGYLPVVDPNDCDYPDDITAYFLSTEADGGTVDPIELTNMQRLYCKVLSPGITVADSATEAATSAYAQINVSGSVGDTMEGFDVQAAANAMNGIF